jgi:hypothetical protein
MSKTKSITKSPLDGVATTMKAHTGPPVTYGTTTGNITPAVTTNGKFAPSVTAVEFTPLVMNPPEPRFTTHTFVITDTEPLQLVSDIPKTQREVEEQIERIRQDGMVFRSTDGLTITTYMPSSIQKVTVRLTPYKEPDENQQQEG